jgi:hypothetical protein
MNSSDQPNRWAILNGPDRRKAKSGLLSFLIANAKIPEVSNNLLNSPLFPDLMVLAQSTKHPSIAQAFYCSPEGFYDMPLRLSQLVSLLNHWLLWRR